jgi:hypothetical protein
MQLRRTVSLTIGGVWGDEPDGIYDLAVVRVADFDMESLTAGRMVPTQRRIDPGQRGRRLLREGDLLLEKSGGGEKQNVGRVVQWTGEHAAVCSNFVNVLRPTDWCDSRYLAYLHRSLYGLGWPNACTKQTTGIQNLDVGAYLRVPVPVLSLGSQRRIADFLDREADNIAAAARAARAVPTALRAGFVEERRRRLVSSLPTTRLARITVSLDSRRVPLNREERSHRQGPVPYWGANSIQDHIDDYLFDETLVLVGEDGAPFFDQHRDVAWVIRGKSWVNNHAHVLRALHGWSPEYLAQVLSDTDYRYYITGATRDKLTQDALNSIRVPGLPLEEQEAVVRQLARVASVQCVAMERAELIACLLSAYRDSLIHEAVTGKLDVTKVSDRQMDERLHAAAENRLDEVPF